VPVLVDTLDEASETATLTLSNASNATISDATGTLTITDDDDAPTLSINDVSYTESGSAGNATFTVTLSEASAQEVIVSYASSDVSTTEDSDYTGISGTVAIAPGSTSATIDLPILVDTLDEASETATLTLSSPTNATISDATGTLTIVDDDDPPSLSINDVSYDESGTAGNATFTVTLSSASSQEVTVNYASSDVSTAAGSDYTGVSGTVTIAAGATSATFNVPVLTDTLDEATETATLTLSDATNATISDATGELEIKDDDTAPTLSINDISFTEATGDATLTVTLSKVSGQDVTVEYGTTIDGTATDSVDYTVGAGTITIPAGSTTATIDVAVIGDSLDEPNETINVLISNPTGATITDNIGVITINDDDDLPTLSIDDVSYTESGTAGNATFTVTLSAASSKEVTVDYASSNNSATAASDYTAVSGTVTIAAGATTATFNVPVLTDTLDEVSETATLTLSNASNATISDATGTLTITDDDDPPSLSINNVSYTESGSAGNATFTVTLSVASSQEVTVNYASSDVSTTAASDYTGVSGTVTIAAGATSATFDVPVLADTLDEASETATITLSGATNATISDATGTLTIVDDDTAPTLSINDISFTEATGDATLTVTLSKVSGQDVTVDYATSDDTATAGTDYTAGTGTITIPAGSTSATIDVAVKEDSLDEVDETVEITLSNPTGATIADGTGVITINDDDTGPTLSINDVSYTESGSAGNATFTVTLSEASAQDIEVDYATSDGTAASGSDYTASTGTVTILAGNTSQTFNVPVLVDTLDEGNETATLTLSNASNATISDATGTLTIVDDDDAPTLSINDVSYTESGSAGNATFTVTLSEASGQEVTVDYTSSDVSTTAASDYTGVSGTVTIAAGATTATFNVPVLADTLDEASETATLTLSNASNATISDATGTLTIEDDDDAPTLSIGDVSFGETTGNVTVTVTLSEVSAQDVVVSLATSDGTATAGTDYTAGTGTITIPAGSTTATFDVAVTGDSLDEADETINVNLSSPTNATIADGTGVITINDDDTGPTLSINDVSYTESGSAGNATFTVTLSEVSGQEVTVDYASSDVSTTAGSDYTGVSGTVTIAAGATSATFDVPVLAR
jgi:carbon monoxide dehydrogenase subunit G